MTKYPPKVCQAALTLSRQGWRYYDIIPELQKRFPKEKHLKDLTAEKLNSLLHRQRKEEGTNGRRKSKNGNAGRAIPPEVVRDMRHLKFKSRYTYETVSEKIAGKYGIKLAPGKIKELLHQIDESVKVSVRGPTLMFDMETDKDTAMQILVLLLQQENGHAQA